MDEGAYSSEESPERVKYDEFLGNSNSPLIKNWPFNSKWGANGTRIRAKFRHFAAAYT